MQLLTTSFIMQHARVLYPDTHLKYADAAELNVQDIVGKTFDEIEDEYGTIPKEFAIASLMVADTLIEYGEPNPHTGLLVPMSGFKLPFSLKSLLEKYSKPGIEDRIAYIENMLRHNH